MTPFTSILLLTATIFVPTLSVKCPNCFVDGDSNCNNVANQIGTNHVSLLGHFSTTDDCINACIANGTCDSYTYFTSTSSSNKMECWAYINNIVWLKYPVPNANCGRIIYKCKTNADCSFNGVCGTSTGNCTCRAGWSGYRCGDLVLLPAQSDSGYNMVDNGARTSSWGGSVMFDRNKNIYAMFVAEMQGHCGIGSWLRNSQIMFAESQPGNFNSKYTRKSRLLVPFAHSPGIIFAPDTNEYMFTYVHNKTDHDTQPCMTCTNGYTDPTCSHHNNMTEMTAFRYIKNLSLASDIRQWSDPILLNAIPKGDSNFALTINKDGSLIGMIRTSAIDIHLVTASNWKDNRTYVVHPGLFPWLPKAGTEDMFVYKDCNGKYHALFHNRAPAGNGYHDQMLCGAHAFSEDGIRWVYGGTAFGNTVKFTNGSSFTFLRRERPHLVFDPEDGCTPIGLTSAVDYYKDASYTFVQPIKTK